MGGCDRRGKIAGRSGGRLRCGEARWCRRGKWVGGQWRSGGCGEAVVVAEAGEKLGPGRLHELILADVGGEGGEGRGGVVGGGGGLGLRPAAVIGKQVVEESGGGGGQGCSLGGVDRERLRGLVQGGGGPGRGLAPRGRRRRRRGRAPSSGCRHRYRAAEGGPGRGRRGPRGLSGPAARGRPWGRGRVVVEATARGPGRGW